jgi:hypothetical protein
VWHTTHDVDPIVIKGACPDARESTFDKQLQLTVKMHTSLALATLSLLSAARAQQVGSLTAESKPKINWKTCTGTGGNSCTSKNTPIVLDANWRWTHGTSGSTNCYTGSKWDTAQCPDNKTCAKNCVVEGAEYASMSREVTAAVYKTDV